MDRIYRNFWEESASLTAKKISESEKKFFDDKILLKKTKVEENNRTTNYYTLQIFDSLFCYDTLKQNLIEILANCLSGLLKQNNYKKSDKVLVVGLGNEKITADSLGALTTNGLHITRHIIENENTSFQNKSMPNLSAIKSSVSGITGLKSFDIIMGTIERTQPDFVIAVDTLACKSITRLSSAIQISDIGIEPGSGINNAKQKLDMDSLGLPVIAIGVPFVIYASNILREFAVEKNIEIKPNDALGRLIVTSKEIDIIVNDFAYVISQAINEAIK